MWQRAIAQWSKIIDRVANKRQRRTGGRANNTAWTRSTGAYCRSEKINAQQIGRDLLNRSGNLQLGRRHKADPWIFVIAATLSAIGIIIIYSIAPGLYSGNQASVNKYIIKLIGLVVIGMIAYFAVRRVPFDFWRKHAHKIFLVGLIICIMLPVLAALKVPVANCTLGACRWYDFHVITFQPAELLKLGTVLFMAAFLSERAMRGKLNNRLTLIEVMLVMAISLMVIVLLQKDMGTGVALLAIFLIQLFMSGIKWQRIAVMLVLMVGGFIMMIAMAPHRLDRVATFFNQGNAKLDYHINQALIGLGSGGLTGRGLGQSVQAYGWLPEAVNDSIFAIIGETTGLVGTVTVLMLFTALIITIFKAVQYMPNMFLRLVIAGVAGWIIAHVLANTMSMIHLIPLTGITLPLVSAGGTSLVLMFIALGIVAHATCYTSRVKVTDDDMIIKGGDDEDRLRRRRQRGAYSTNRRYM